MKKECCALAAIEFSKEIRRQVDENILDLKSLRELSNALEQACGVDVDVNKIYEFRKELYELTKDPASVLYVLDYELRRKLE